jgi:multicomponent Na+:H+ antiporter subunit E
MKLGGGNPVRHTVTKHAPRRHIGSATTLGAKQVAEDAAKPADGGNGSGKRKRGFPSVDNVGHAVSLAVTLFIVWLLLSGFFGAFLITLGVLSCLLIVYIALRMDVVDHEAHPIHLTMRIVGYWVWLLKEIWLSGIDVTKRILLPGSPISPTMVQLKTTQTSELGQVVYANSITLTPGTFTIRVFDDQILVHALSQDGADALAEGDMDRRVTAVEGQP